MYIIMSRATCELFSSFFPHSTSRSHIASYQVQLSTTHEISHIIPSALTALATPGAMAPKILALIGEEERKYQETLSDAYHTMGERTFKGLRRALPLTRQKLDWDKVSIMRAERY
jgi:hypothetical protein